MLCRYTAELNRLTYITVYGQESFELIRGLISQASKIKRVCNMNPPKSPVVPPPQTHTGSRGCTLTEEQVGCENLRFAQDRNVAFYKHIVKTGMRRSTVRLAVWRTITAMNLGNMTQEDVDADVRHILEITGMWALLV